MNRSLLISTFLPMMMLLSAGCATKQFVRNSTKPIDDRLAEVSERSTSNSARIDTLDDRVERDVSRLDERSLSAQTRADEAVDRAANARAAADDAAEAATGARGMAERGLAGVDGLSEALRDLQDFDMIHGESVYFGFASSELDEKALGSLGKIANAASAAKTYAVVVKGFTDSTGAKEYNLALSKQRAESVVRHLTTSLAIPLYRIHQLGLGTDEPTADNKTSAGRKQNRRVEIQVFVATSETPKTVSEAFE